MSGALRWFTIGGAAAVAIAVGTFAVQTLSLRNTVAEAAESLTEVDRRLGRIERALSSVHPDQVPNLGALDTTARDPDAGTTLKPFDFYSSGPDTSAARQVDEMSAQLRQLQVDQANGGTAEELDAVRAEIEALRLRLDAAMRVAEQSDRFAPPPRLERRLAPERQAIPRRPDLVERDGYQFSVPDSAGLAAMYSWFSVGDSTTIQLSSFPDGAPFRLWAAEGRILRDPVYATLFDTTRYQLLERLVFLELRGNSEEGLNGISPQSPQQR